MSLGDWLELESRRKFSYLSGHGKDNMMRLITSLEQKDKKYFSNILQDHGTYSNDSIHPKQVSKFND